MRLILGIIILLIAPFTVSAADQLAGSDLAINASGIFFSEDSLIVGDDIRIYAQIQNVGDVDVSGYVSFYQGDQPIGDSQVVSVRSNGALDEVYVDFIVPAGTFNIRGVIKGTDPEDTNPTNDEAITTLFTPIYDDDRDGVENDVDNCAQDANSNQLDSDGDDLGDVCDDDDDNDTLTDEVEAELGTDPFDTDTDGDGVADDNDYAPTDPNVQYPPEAEPELVVVDEVVDEPEETVEETTSLDSSEDSDIDPEETDEEEVEDAEKQVTKSILHVSPNAIFSYRKTSWNTYQFKAQTPSDSGYRFEWDFGDGVTSAKAEVEHKFSGYGEYNVTLRVTDPSDRVSHDATIVEISFFNLHNRLVQSLIGILFVLMVIALIMVGRLKDKTGKKRAVKTSSKKITSTKETPKKPRVELKDLPPEPEPSDSGDHEDVIQL